MSQTIKQQQAEFQTYLEKAGVTDQLTKLLVSLYQTQNRPQNKENTLEYIRKFFPSQEKDVKTNQIKSALNSQSKHDTNDTERASIVEHTVSDISKSVSINRNKPKKTANPHNVPMVYANKLYEMISIWYPQKAGKLTGMFLQNHDERLVITYLYRPHKLKKKIDRFAKFLAAYNLNIK